MTNSNSVLSTFKQGGKIKVNPKTNIKPVSIEIIMKLFISCAHTDKWQIKQLVEILEDAGHKPWFDNKLLPRQDWKQALADEIVDCEGFVYAMTPESIASEWCQWEFAKAVELGKPVIPILVQPKTKVPDNIRRYQYADFSEGPTPKNVAKLMGGLSQIAINIPKAEASHWTRKPRRHTIQSRMKAFLSPNGTILRDRCLRHRSSVQRRNHAHLSELVICH